MKKWIVALAALGILWATHPFQGIDAGSLCVVETLLVEPKQGGIYVASGALNGTGATVSEALQDMAEHTPGALFLRQVRRIILCDDEAGIQPLMGLPEEIPMGALIYTSGETAASLQTQDALDQVLEAREQRNRTMPSLAVVKNHWLEEHRNTVE